MVKYAERATTMNAAKQPQRKWIKSLPRSKMRYPTGLRNKAKYMFWRVYTPLHPLMRNTSLALGVVSHAGRQNYLLGRIAPGVPLEDFVQHLISQGFANHFVAWKDDGEVVSLRRVENFTHQYHIRIFADGEVRGHYEFTPTCYPFAHRKAICQEPRKDFFAQLCGGRVV